MRNCLSNLFPRRQQPIQRRSGTPPRWRLHLEQLEDRTLPAAFTVGDLVVLQSDSQTSSAASVSLLEFATTGTGQSPLNTVSLPTTTAASGNAALTQSGSATSEGFLERSQDGHYLLVTGYNAAPGTTFVATGSADRIVGRIDVTGSADTTTRVPGYSGSNIRSAASADGSTIYVGGQPAGITTVTFGTQPSSATTINSGSPRMVGVFDGQLYATLTSLGTVGSGLPTSGPASFASISAGGATSNQYYFLDRDASVPGVDQLFVADGGLRKYSFDGVTWTLRGSIPGAYFGLVIAPNGSGTNIYATTGGGTSAANTLVKYTDSAAYNAAGSFSAVTTLATAAAGKAFRGLAFAPTPAAPTVTTPTSAAITDTAATLGGNVSFDGGSAITERGIVYARTSDNNDPAIGGTGVTKMVASGTTGVFTVDITGLAGSTGYSFKAYAMNSIGTSYTSVATFTTANQTPGVDMNAGLTLFEGGTAIILGTDLAAGDDADSGADLLFTIEDGPLHGTLLVDGVPVTTFTQADLDDGLVTYTHDGSETTDDSFIFTITDSQSATSTSYTFDITITPVSDDPVLVDNTGDSMYPGDTVVITSSKLRVTDVDNAADELTYTLTATPTGVLKKNGLQLGLDGTFTQEDIDNDRISYTAPASGSSDSFTFTVSDGAGGSLGSTDFTVDLQAIPVVYINEIFFDPPGIDSPNEYIELRSTPNAVMPTRMYLVAIEGDTENGPGNLQNIFDLSGKTFGSNGIMVLLQQGSSYVPDANSSVYTNSGSGAGWGSGAGSSIGHTGESGRTEIDDGSVTLMLVRAATAPDIASDIDNDDDGTPDGAFFSGWSVMDSVGVLDGDASDVAYGDINFVPADGITRPGSTVAIGPYSPGYVARIGASTGHDSADWLAAVNETGTAPDFVLPADAGDLSDASLRGAALDHLGAANDFTLAAPTDISLSSSSVDENLPTDTVIGTFSTTDPTPGDTFTYELVSGEDAWDNFLFTISGDTLQTADSFDFEWTTTLSIRVRTTDSTGVWFEKVFLIAVNDINDNAPVIDTLPSLFADENQTLIVALSATDIDTVGGPIMFSISGGADQAQFDIDSGNLIFTSAKDYESDPQSYEVEVTASDGVNSSSLTITIMLADVNEAPSSLNITSTTIAEDFPTGMDIGSLISEDQDAGETFAYSFVAGTGSEGADNAAFLLVGNALQLSTSLDYESQSIYHVGIRSTDHDGLYIDLFFDVTVTDVNDNAPEFTTLAAQTVEENQTVVAGLAATDADTVGDPVTISISGGADEALFDIVAGNLVFTSARDFEIDADHYEVEVSASDGLNTTNLLIMVTLLDVNDNAPVITTLADQSAEENQTFVAALTATDVDTVGNTVTFSITGGADAALFDIVAGDLVFTSARNFETDAQVYEVQVTASDGANSTDLTITVTLSDVNDAPTAIQITAATVAEDAGGGTEIGILSTDDEDAGESFTYSFVTGTGSEGANNGAFVLVADSLQLDTSLDYETQSIYHVGIRSTDHDGLYVDLFFDVTVTDLNDNTPEITTTASQSVEESQTLVAELTATDADTVGGPVTFSISGGADQALFDIVAGNLVFTSARDYENDADSYEVEVTATDGLNSSSLLILVALTDANDNAPAITTLADQSIDENQTLVAALTATDVDTVGDPAMFSITGGADQALFDIVAGDLVFKSARNFETDASVYEVQVTASDGANSTNLTITVTLVDSNDTAPTITTLAAQSVAENQTQVAALTANDPDTVGAAVTFSITGGADQALFDIVSGNLVFTSAKNYETDPHSYQVQVAASDGVNSSALTITVTLTDVNDNVPVITTLASQSVAENQTLVAALTATDADTVGGPVTFSITGGADQALFDIVSGNLVFKAAKNYEADAHAYQVQVTASDSLNTTNLTIAVTLTDVNEGPSAVHISATTVAENASLATEIGTLTTDDQDAGDSFTYSFVTGVGSQGADNAAFTLMGNSLQVNTSLDYETKTTYHVGIRSTDSGNLFLDLYFDVTVTDVNDNAPAITTSASQSVAENQTQVANLTATDVDTVGGPVTFSISGGADQALFDIVAGNLVFTSARDYESDAHLYHVQVTASDGVNTTNLTIAVTLTDTNDNAPVITTLASQSVAENQTLVAALTATDADTVGGPTTFSITGGTNQALFDIVSGNLVFKSAKDFEADAHSYQVQVTASDGLNTTNLTITVTLTDVNDNAPVITTSASQSVPENQTTVAALNATDADTVGGPVTFSITGGADQLLFDIVSGNLVFNSARNFETDAHTYQVQVTASDGLNSTNKAITVTLTDLNDTPPVITTSASLSIAENLTQIATLTSTDADTVGGPVTFSITGGMDEALFDIVAGKLVFQSAKDYETDAHSYDVEVTASDGINTSSLTITVTLTNVNEAPAGSDNTITIDEDFIYTFTANDFGFSDGDSPANLLQAVRIASLPLQGALRNNGVNVTLGQFISLADLSAGKLKFTPAANASGAAYASFTFQVQDDGGTSGSGVDLDPTPNTISFAVTSVNDAPGGTNKTVSLNEDASYTFAASDFGFGDPSDSPANLLLAVKISSLPAHGTLTDDGNAILINQDIPLADITGGKLVFTPAANGNGNSYASFTFQVQDDGGTDHGGVDVDPTANTIIIKVVSINDAPSGTSKTIVIDEDIAYTFASADFGFSDTSDSPANHLQAVKITTLPGAGALTDNGLAVTLGQFISLADIVGGKLRFTPAANANGASYAAFTFQVQDDGGTALGGANLDPSAKTMTFDVTSVNDAPAGVDLILTVDALTSYTFQASDFGFADADDNPANALQAVTITTLPSLGILVDNGLEVFAGQVIPLADIEAGALTFTAGTSGSFTTFTFQVQDDGGTSDSGVDLDPVPNVITVNSGAVPISGNPASQDVVMGQKVTFQASSSAARRPTVRWQVSYDDGATWSDVPSATTKSLTLTATLGLDGSLYRAIFTNSLGQSATKPARLTVHANVRAGLSSQGVTVPVGTPTVFTAIAKGSPTPAVQWQVSDDRGQTYVPIDGEVSSTYAFMAHASDDGRLYRAVFTNAFGTTATGAISLTVASPPEVILDPDSLTVPVKGRADFSAAANPDTAFPAKVQWQVSSDAVNFSDIPKATSTTLSLFKVPLTLDGKFYRAMFVNSVGQVASAAAGLNVTGVPLITRQPSSQIVTAGDEVTFTAAALGSPASDIEWQVSTDKGLTYDAIPGGDSATLTFTAEESDSGNFYQVVFTNSEGSITSRRVLLTVDVAPSVDPLSDMSVTAGQVPTFSATATGSPTPTFQWQVSVNGGSSWSNIAGATAALLTLPRVFANQDGNLYRVIASNRAGQAVTDAALLTVDAAPVITVQPVPQLVSSGDMVVFGARAKGSPTASVQWRVSTDHGLTYAEIAGGDTDTLAFAAQASDSGNLYRATFTNAKGSVTTRAVALVVGFAPTATAPLDTSVPSGGSATFTVTPSSSPTSAIQWQVSTDNGGIWANIPTAKTKTLTLTRLTGAASGNQYRAVLSNTLGTYTTPAATLTVTGKPAVTLQPVAQDVVAGNTVSFSAFAKGSPAATVQWQVSSDNGQTFVPLPSATSTTLSFTAQLADNGRLYQAIFTNVNGSVATTAVALTVGVPAQITVAPNDLTVSAGQTATFTVFVIGSPNPIVRWQVSSDGGATWIDILTARSSTLSLAAVKASASGNLYRAITTNRFGQGISAAATLTVNGKPEIV